MQRLMARGLGAMVARSRGCTAMNTLLSWSACQQTCTWRGYNSGPVVTSDHNSGTMDDGKSVVSHPWMPRYSNHEFPVVRTIREQSGVDLGYHIIPKSRDHLLKYQPKREDLEPRTMLDSHSTATIPLGVDLQTRERYVNHLGRVRLGRIMEELDMFAVWMCHRHVKLPNHPEGVALPYTFVTLLVDKVEFWNVDRLKVDHDIQLSGNITWTGTSSMEITIYVRQKAHEEYIDMTKAIFLMVARNATNTGPAPINPLKPGDDIEKQVWEEADKRQKARRNQIKESVFNSPPREHEQTIMYEILRRTTPPNGMDLNRRELPARCRWMEDSMQSTMIAPFPENRNAQNTIFGGYLMRQAVEISFIQASLYQGGRPLLECISDISFMQAVEVNTFLQMTAHVVYTAQNYLQLMTVAQIWDVTGKVQTTNVFYLTYKADRVLDEVLPRTYREMLWYVHGRRKLLSALDLQPEYPNPNEKPKETTAKVT